MTDQEEQKRPHSTGLPPALEAAPRLDPPIPSEPAVTPSQPIAFDEAHSDFASFQEDYIRHYIALADTKAGVIFTLVAGIIGYLLSNAPTREALLEPSCSAKFVLPILALLSLGMVAVLAFLVIAPRLAAPSSEGLVFFGAVASRTSAEDYTQDVASANAQKLTEARLKHCYDVARICSRKYQLLKGAIWLIPPSLLLALITTILK